MKNETTLKAELMAQLVKIPGSLPMRHEDFFRAGVPDMSFSARKMTTWLEAKHLKPRFLTKRLQELTCKQLAAASHCLYIFWDERGPGPMTFIVDPRKVVRTGVTTVEWSEYVFGAPGFDHQAVAEFLRGYHDHHGQRQISR